MNNETILSIIKHSDEILKDKQEQVKLVLVNILSGGHTLIEDSPGVGKTTLVKYLGKAFGMNISRIQFTNDLLPADILGTTIFNKENHSFDFHQGPIFGELILADELNRAPPKTQSALLQAMEERNISIEGNHFDLPEHFTVIATQNPNQQLGTFQLPESQLDRFSMKMKMGYPDKNSTLSLLKSSKQNIEDHDVLSLSNVEELTNIQKTISNIKIDDSIFEQIYSLLELSRIQNDFVSLSNRCGIDIVKVIKAYAFIQGRNYVIPDDLFYLFPFIAGHRLIHPEHSDIDREHLLANQLLEKL